MTDDISASHSEESPTAPLPPTASTEPFPIAASQSPESGGASAVPDASPGTVAAIIAGALVIAVLAFGGGWFSRGFTDNARHMAGFSTAACSHDSCAGPGSQGSCGIPGAPDGQLNRPGMQNAPGRRGPQNGPGLRSRRGIPGWKQAPSQSPTATVPGAPTQ